MKLVKEFLNEFERGLEPKIALGIGPRVFKIQKWFESLNIPEEDYIIGREEVIFKYSLLLKKINWLPDNFYIEGSLDLDGTSLTQLPKGLHVKTNLYLNNTQITELPDDLYVEDNIYVNAIQKKLITFIQNSIFKNKLKIWK
jgi:hypothetical protein